MRPVLLAVAGVLAVVTASVQLTGAARPAERATAVRETAPVGEQLWTGTARLLQTPDGSLTLCGGVMLTSLPPAGCGGARVRGLDPMTVVGAERFANGTITTPSVRLVGTWDGEALTPTRPVELAEPPTPEPEPEPAIAGPGCPEPDGGWPFDRVDRAGWQRVMQYAAAQPDGGTPRVDDSQQILTVPFTGDLERHRAALAVLYDGPLCVEHVERSERELRAVFDRVQQELTARGLQLMEGSPGGTGRPQVEVRVVAVTEAERAELEAAYGGVLQLRSFLVEVP